MSCPKMTTERGGGGRGVAVSDIDFVWTLIKFIETIFAFGLQDDLTMITRLVQLALLGGIVRGKAVWDSHCHNKHCQGNPVRCSSPSCHNSLIYEYGQYVHPALKNFFIRASGNSFDDYTSRKKYTEQIEYSCPKGVLLSNIINLKWVKNCLIIQAFCTVSDLHQCQTSLIKYFQWNDFLEGAQGLNLNLGKVLFLGLGFNYNGQNDWAAGKGMLLFSIWSYYIEGHWGSLIRHLNCFLIALVSDPQLNFRWG